ncbi:hypothetical protein QOT17_002659 [Balamuthia mandrillaris]
MSVVWTVLASGFAQIVASHVLMFGCWYPLGKRVDRELCTNQAFRPMNDLRMGLYMPFISPFVHAILLICARSVFGGALNAYFASYDSPIYAGMAFSLAFWLLGQAHGIIIDYCCYKHNIFMSFWFLLLSAVLQAVNGAVVFWMLS